MIPPDDLARLVLPFQRSGADRTSISDGLGLGLSIVAAIAEAHGAWLQANTLPGGGLAVQAGFPCPRLPLDGRERPAPGCAERIAQRQQRGAEQHQVFEQKLARKH